MYISQKILRLHHNGQDIKVIYGNNRYVSPKSRNIQKETYLKKCGISECSIERCMQFTDQSCDYATGRNTGEVGFGSIQGLKFLSSNEYRINWVSSKHLYSLRR